MIDRDAVRGVLIAVHDDTRLDRPADLDPYVDRIIKLAEVVGRCGALTPEPWVDAPCDLPAGHRGQHSGMAYPPPIHDGESVQGFRVHWTEGDDVTETRARLRQIRDLVQEWRDDPDGWGDDTWADALTDILEH